MTQPVPSPPPPGYCNTCAYWDAPDVTQTGRCRFNAPLQPQTAHIQVTAWPRTEPTDWCGQYLKHPSHP